jgi:hypothetical protein
MIKPGKYRHYRTKQLYEVIGTALHSETYEEMVIYKALYDCEKFGLHQLWARPAKMFLEMVQDKEVEVKRFEYIAD